MAGLRKETKHKLIKGGIAILVIATFFIVMWIICKSLGLNTIEGIKSLVLSGGAWSGVLYIALYTILCIVLCFVPGTSMLMIGAGVAIFGANWKTFLMCFAGVVLSSMLMYVIGRFGGSKAISFIVGKEDREKAVSLLNERGTIYFPAFMIFPLFPDDALCCVAGLGRMNIWFYLLSIVLGRGIGVATIIFGIKIIPFECFNTVYDWIVCITVCVFWVILVFYLLHRLEKWINKKNTH